MSNAFESLGILDFDHIEFAVADLEQSSEFCLRMGFEKVGSRKIAERRLESDLYAQNDIRFLLSKSTDSKDPVAQFVEKHGNGVIDVAFRCQDAVTAFEMVVNRGAKPMGSPKSVQKDFGSCTVASIHAFGDIRHSFISRTGSLFHDGFDEPVKHQNKGFGLQRVDHLTVNVEMGAREKWTEFYQTIFGLQNSRFFDIYTVRTGLYSSVMQSPNGVIKMPFNEASDPKSQIQEFIDIFHGPGVQHLALATNDIRETLRPLKREGLKFLDTPHAYYEMLSSRVPGITESLGELEELGIQVDGDAQGYLLQIFTQPVMGPFFYEVIQRKGNDGFGEGNFRALFEAMERDQIRRGVLK